MMFISVYLSIMEFLSFLLRHKVSFKHSVSQVGFYMVEFTANSIKEFISIKHGIKDSIYKERLHSY